MDVIADIDKGPLAVLSWVVRFWYEAEDAIHFSSVVLWVVSILVEEAVVDVLGFQGEFLLVLFLVPTVHGAYW